MEIKLLDKSIYAGYPVTIDYVSEYYFDIEIIGGDDEFNIRMIKKNFGYLYHHQGNTDYERLYEKWIDNSRAFGVFDNDRLIGVMELFLILLLLPELLLKIITLILFQLKLQVVEKMELLSLYH